MLVKIYPRIVAQYLDKQIAHKRLYEYADIGASLSATGDAYYVNCAPNELHSEYVTGAR